MSGNNLPITGRQVKFGIGIETVVGYPVKAQALLELVDGGLTHEFQRKFSKVLNSRPSSRRKAAKGAFTFQGQLRVEVTPEGGFPRLLMGRFPLSSAGAGPSYTHTFANLFGSKTFTLIRQEPAYLKVYPGCRVSNFRMETDKTSTEVQVAQVDITALDELVFDLQANPGIIATFGMDVASFDALSPYTSEQAVVYYNNQYACVRNLNVSFARGLGLHECLNKKNGAEGTYELGGDSQADAQAYYAEKTWINQDFGVNPSNAFAPTAKVITAPIALVFDPPVNPSGFINRMTVEFPSADITGGEEMQGEQEIRQNITISPLDNAAGDGKITLVNSISGATLSASAAAIPFATIPPSQSKWYWGGDIPAPGGGVLPPSTDIGGTDDVNQFDLAAGYHADGTVAGLADGISTMPTGDGFFVGWTVMVIKGTNKGQKATITGYTAATRRFTCGGGIDGLATGDSVALYK